MGKHHLITSPRVVSRKWAADLIDQEVEILGCGIFQKRMVIILGLGNTADAVEILAIGYILGKYDQPISPWEASFLTSAVYTGMLIGGIVGACLGDNYGRRPIILGSLLINLSAACLSALSPSLYWFILFRMLAGLGVGGIVPALFATCLEHIPKASTGLYITIVSSFWMVGAILTASMAWIMLGEYVETDIRIMDISWRYFAFMAGTPALLCLILMYKYVPESPRFLASKGRYVEANETLYVIYRINNASRMPDLCAMVENQIDSLSPTRKRDTAKLDQSKPSSMCSTFYNNLHSYYVQLSLVFSPATRYTTILFIITTYCLSFGSYGMSTWITKLFQAMQFKNVYANAFIYAGATLPGNLWSMYIINKWHIRNVLATNLLLSSFCALLFAIMNYCSQVRVPGIKQFFIVLIASLFNVFSTAAWNMYDVLSAKTFSINIRVSALSIISCTGRFGAICAQLVNGLLLGPPEHILALLIVTCTVMAVGAVAAILLPISNAKINENETGNELFNETVPLIKSI